MHGAEYIRDNGEIVFRHARAYKVHEPRERFKLLPAVGLLHLERDHALKSKALDRSIHHFGGIRRTSTRLAANTNVSIQQ